jgi:hypothetical protein
MFLRPSRLTHTWVCASTAASADASVRVQRTCGHIEGRHVRVHARMCARRSNKLPFRSVL